jgi:hypothetical protein
MGNGESLPRGCVQYMSAGTGVVHSEMNEGDKTCRFLQVRPRRCCGILAAAAPRNARAPGFRLPALQLGAPCVAIHADLG